MDTANKEMAAVSYTANAQRAAASGTYCGGNGCPACVKAGLPVLLVRPGLAEKQYAHARKEAITPLLDGVADPVLTSAGYVMRTLRQGYLYAYYEVWHTDEIVKQRGWQVFRVDDGGYLRPVPLAAADTPATEFTCVRSESYATAMLFVIPNARKASRVWVGFSASPWSREVRRTYSSNPKLREARMACIDVKDGTARRSIPLTAANIVQCVADYDPELDATVLRGNPYPRRIQAEAGDMSGRAAKPSPQAQDRRIRSLVFPELNAERKVRPEDAALVHRQAQELIARIPAKPYTDENLLIVSVPDAEGVTTEAAQRRITLCNDAAEWAAERVNRGKLKSALQLEGMYELMRQNGEERKAHYAGYAHLNGKPITREKFNQMKKAEELPQDADFIPDTINRIGVPYPIEDYLNGTLYIPSVQHIEQEIEDALERFEDGLQKVGSEPAYRKYLEFYRLRQKIDNDRLTQVEKDYKAWLESDALKLVTHYDFDENTPVDGVYYCLCVANITLGGPITDEGLKWYRPLLGEDPNQKEALLTRALLGNQAEYIKWFTELDQQSKNYDILKGVLDLDPIQARLKILADHLGQALARQAHMATQQVLQVSAAVAAKLDAVAAQAGQGAGALSQQFQYQFKLLVMRLMTRSEGAAGGMLMHVRLNMAEAVKLWNGMAGELERASRQAGQVAQRQVESLVLNAGVLVEANGSPKAGMAVIDAYLWVTDAASVRQGAQTVGRYLLRPAEIYGAEAAAKLARYVDFTELMGLGTLSMRALASLSGVLSAGSFALQTMMMNKAWRDYAQGNEQERRAAAMGMLSAGLGMQVALLELGGKAAELARKEALAQGCKRLAGWLLAGATAIDAVQSGVNAYWVSQDGDDGATTGYRIQGVLFALAAVALTGAATGGYTIGAGASAIALSAGLLTGLGLVLVALGVIVGFVILLIKDRPVETWAKKTLWGSAPEKWLSPEHEAQEANKVMLCAQVDFSYRWNLGDKIITSEVPVVSSGGWGTPVPMAERFFERQAWLRMVMPTAFRQRLPWTLCIYGLRGGRDETLVGRASFDGVAGVSCLRDEIPGVRQSTFKEEEKDGIVTMELSAMLDMSKYDNALAKVEVYVRSSSAEAGDPLADRLLIIDEEIRN